MAVELDDTTTNKWSETDASNTQPAPDGAPNGTVPSQAEPIWRGIMATVKRFWNRINGVVTTTGASGAYVYTPANTSYPTAYVSGEVFCWKAHQDSVGSDTLNINGLGAKALKKITANSGKVAINAGDIKSGQFVVTRYDGTDMIVENPTDPGVFPAGLILPYGGQSAPAGWLLCYGQAVSRTTYAALFTAISTTFGAGDGTTTFNVPDMRGRVAAGVDNMGGVAANRLTSGGSGITGTTLGAAGGAETVALSVAQMPAHTHTVGGGASIMLTNGSNNDLSGAGNFNCTATAGGTDSAGSGAAHQNTQPTITTNYIIKT